MTFLDNPQLYLTQSVDFTDLTSQQKTVWNTLPNNNQSISNNTDRQAYSPGSVVLDSYGAHLIATPQPLDGQPFTSGVLSTWGTFHQNQGVFAFYAKTPKGRGFLASIKLKSLNVNDGEITVMEVFSNDPTTVYQQEMWVDQVGYTHNDSTSYQVSDTSAGYHLYILNWQVQDSGNTLQWLIDDVIVGDHSMDMFTYQYPLYMEISLSIPGDLTTSYIYGPWPGTFDIQWVKVYRWIDRISGTDSDVSQIPQLPGQVWIVRVSDGLLVRQGDKIIYSGRLAQIVDYEQFDLQVTLEYLDNEGGTDIVNVSTMSNNSTKVQY